MTAIEEQLRNIQNGFLHFKTSLTNRLNDPASKDILNHLELREYPSPYPSQIYNFTNSSPRPTIKEKVVINKIVRENIRAYIADSIRGKLASVIKNKDSHNFVFVLNEVWGNYQRFVFAHEFACDKIRQFFETFPKMNNARDFVYSVGKAAQAEEVVHISIIAVNELKKYFEEQKIFENFTDHFGAFLLN